MHQYGEWKRPSGQRIHQKTGEIIPFWQCGSAFPAFAENYARFLKAALFQPNGKRNAGAMLLARLIIESNEGDGRCGFNQLKLANPRMIRESERRIHEGHYEFFLKAREKYDEYTCYLQNSGIFQHEWGEIKRAFPKRTKKGGVLHRTLVPERNWVQGRGAAFQTGKQRFEAIFDLFCWKYFLWGMRGDEPLLMKPSVVFTPLGTQIFIPGYLSLDAKRDLNFGRITQLHRARGIRRQGGGFSAGRSEKVTLKKRAVLLLAEAKRRGLKGKSRHEFLQSHLESSLE